MTDWIKDWVYKLSEPNTETGLAECPFAKKAWSQGQVKVVESQNLWETVHREVDNFGDHKVVLCVQENPDQTYLELDAACMALNRWFSFIEKDVWLLSYQIDKTIVFIQSLSELNSASFSLEKLGYYKNYSPEDYSRLISQRRFIKQDVGHA